MLTRAQLLMGNSSQGTVISNQVQGVKSGGGIAIAADGTISVDSQSIVGVMKLGQTAATAAAAYNAYEWPTSTGTVGQQLTISVVGTSTTLAWGDPDGIPWTAKGQLVVGTGSGTQALLSVGTDGQILIADSTQTTGIGYTSNFVATTGSTSTALIPAGSTAARPVSPATGAFRYNSSNSVMEFYNGTAWQVVVSSASGLFVEKTSATGASITPAGTTAQRDASPVAGYFRYNSSNTALEFYNGTAWSTVASSSTGLFVDKTVPAGAFTASAIIPSGTTVQRETPAVGGYLRYNTSENFLEFYNGSTSTWELVAPAGGGVHSFVQPQPAPVQYNTGDLWYDCTTGYFKVYQNCVSPNGWTNVAEPGLPILAGNISASPAFTGGSGTSGTPYTCSVTTTGPGTSVFIVNTVTVTGLAPYQYVPIVDLNAVTNGGRFSFSNQYANAAGVLVFQTIFIDQPVSASGSSYTASIRVGYSSAYIQAIVNVISALSVTAGTISGTPTEGQTLTYTTGVASGGTGPYTYTWVWKKGSDNSVLQTNGATYVIPGSLVGDSVYVVVTATDSVLATANNQTVNYPASPAVIGGSTFPNLPSTLVTGPTQIPQIVSGSWADGADPITSTGCLQISLDGTTFGQGPLTPTNGSLVYQQWAPTGATCGDAAHGTTITGTLTNGTYTNTFSLLLDRNPDSFTLSAITGQALSSTATSNSVTLAGTNAPAYITYTVGSPNTLTNVKVSVGGTAYVTVPTSGTTVTVNPGQTLQFQGDVGGTNNTAYTITVNVGATTASWSVTTATLVASITTPSITSPSNGAVNLNPATNTPTGIPLVSDTYTPLNGAGTVQTSSTWEVYEWIGGASPTAPTTEPPAPASYAAVTGSPFTVSASPFNTVNVPMAALTISSTYYARVKYATTNVTAATSSFSAWSSFGTSASFVPSIGAAYGGGYFGGQIEVFPGEDDGTLPLVTTIYNLIVAPLTAGSLNGQNGGSTPSGIQYKTTSTADAPTATVQNVVYGGTTTDLFKASSAHPVFSTFINGATGPNAGAFNLATGGAGGGTGIGGFNDWYMPAENELEILYFNLKPDATANNTSSGINLNAVPARASNYLSGGPPVQTTNVLFAGGAQAFSTAGTQDWWSSSESTAATAPTSINARPQYFTNGWQFGNVKAGNNYARAIRRVAA